MRGRSDDVSYAFARLVAAACSDVAGNLSVGVWNAPVRGETPEAVYPGALDSGDSHGDAGCIVVDIDGPDWIAHYSGGYLAGETANGWERVGDGANRSRRERRARIRQRARSAAIAASV